MVVLSIVACTVFINKATVDASWYQLYKKKSVEAELNAVAASSSQLKYQTVSQELARVAGKSKEDAAVLSADNDKLKAENAKLSAEKAQLQAEVAGINAKLGKLQVDFNNVTQMMDQQLARLDETRKQLSSFSERNIELTNQLRQKEAESERLELIAKVRMEQIAERDNTIRDLERQMQQRGPAAAVEGEPAVAVKGPAITGQIKAVNPKNDTAAINIGSAQGIKPGMALLVYRGNQLVGTLRIKEVDVAESAGYMTDKRLDPAPGDKVTTSLGK